MADPVKEMQNVPNGVKYIKNAFGAGCAIAAFLLPILAVWALCRRSSE
jgi:hypothetical protein